MTEEQSIEYANKLEPIEALTYYMDYMIRMIFSKHTSEYYLDNPSEWKPITFQIFCSSKNFIKHDVGEGWNNRGYASRTWISLTPGSLYHSVYHNLKI